MTKKDTKSTATTTTKATSKTKPTSTASIKKTQEGQPSSHGDVISAVNTVGTKTQTLAEKYSSVYGDGISDSAIIPVTSMFPGTLFYKSSISTGLEVLWDRMGDVQLLEFKEIKSMLGSQVRFFKDHLISLPQDIIRALRAERYFVGQTLSLEDFESLLSLPIDEIQPKLSGLSNTLKTAVRQKAQYMLASGDLDSVARIKAIEAGLGMSISHDFGGPDVY